MKITKRQLKRIIREEYSRLKRQGLIRESFRDMRHSSSKQRSLEDYENNETMCIDECFDAVPAMMKQICGMGMAHTVTNDIYHICEPICRKYGCDPDHISEIVEQMCCGGRGGR